MMAVIDPYGWGRTALSDGIPPYSGEKRACLLIGRAALAALYDELCTYPAPGLVSLVDNGSHADMDASTFFRSLYALEWYFPKVASDGMRNARLGELKCLGIEAEASMLEATGNVNTHRGAIFTLGLLAWAAGRLFCTGRPLDGNGLGALVRDRWGREALMAPADGQSSHGRLVARRYGAPGAREEAAAGFPHVFKVGLPVLRRALFKGAGLNAAFVQTFFSLMAVVPDNNLLFRGGMEGLAYAREAAFSFLKDGGIFGDDWQERAGSVHRASSGAP